MTASKLSPPHLADDVRRQLSTIVESARRLQMLTTTINADDNAAAVWCHVTMEQRSAMRNLIHEYGDPRHIGERHIPYATGNGRGVVPALPGNKKIEGIDHEPQL